MDASLRVICGLLASPDPARRHAAAIVLAELAPGDPAVVEALGRALTDANDVLSGQILNALEAIGSAAAVPYVLPLLDAASVELKVRAVAMVARAGERMVPDIRRRLDTARGAERLMLVDLLARIHVKAAFDTLLGLLLDPDFEFIKAVCEAVRRHMHDVPARTRSAFHAQLVAFMESPKAKGQERVITSCLLLMGAVGDAQARATLLAHAAPRHSLYVRRHALIGLKNVGLEGTAAAGVVKPLLACLGDPDEGLVRHALDILARVPAVKVDWGAWLASPHAPVRSFAVRRLAADDTPAVNKQLLGLLAHADTEVREVAAGALSGHKSATRLLIEALEDEADPERAWRLAKIVKPHAADIDAKAVKRLAGQAAEDLQAGKPRHEALLYVLRHVDPLAGDRLVLDAGLAHRKARRWTAAVECLRRIVNTELFDDETRYALALCNLKASPKSLTPQLRAEDHALRGLQALLRVPAFKVADRLKKDKALEAADLFYVGFHFAEATGDEKALGVALLEHLAKTAPKSAEGKAAKNKLKLAQAG